MKITHPVTSVCKVTFQKSFIDLKSTQNITLKYSLYGMTSVVVLFAYRQGRQLRKFYQRSCIIILTDLPNAIKKMLDKISFHKHFKVWGVYSLRSGVQ